MQDAQRAQQRGHHLYLMGQAGRFAGLKDASAEGGKGRAAAATTHQPAQPGAQRAISRNSTPHNQQHSPWCTPNARRAAGPAPTAACSAGTGRRLGPTPSRCARNCSGAGQEGRQTRGGLVADDSQAWQGSLAAGLAGAGSSRLLSRNCGRILGNSGVCWLAGLRASLPGSLAPSLTGCPQSGPGSGSRLPALAAGTSAQSGGGGPEPGQGGRGSRVSSDRTEGAAAAAPALLGAAQRAMQAAAEAVKQRQPQRQSSSGCRKARQTLHLCTLRTSRRILWSALASILALLYRFRMTGAPLARHTPLNTADCLQATTKAAVSNARATNCGGRG